ncbi:MAG: cysteine hydrolase [Actinobacteria bacterium]|jgi:nicotinamidase-related amidase|nr:MAG: cysteine hydrolase [Actinomycetota bacterium]
MPVDFRDVLAPSHTAVLTMEMQRGVCGDLATALPNLAEEVAATGVIKNVAKLCDAAREVGVRVVHCTAEFRPDRAGSASNAPLLRMAARETGHMAIGSGAAEVIPEIGPDPRDLVLPRMAGMSPFTGTNVDITLRNLGIRTVVATGVSLNVALVGLVISAVDLGYTVVVATDAAAGVPHEYGQAVLRNTLAMLANLMTSDEIIGHWT